MEDRSKELSNLFCLAQHGIGIMQHCSNAKGKCMDSLLPSVFCQSNVFLMNIFKKLLRKTRGHDYL